MVQINCIFIERFIKEIVDKRSYEETIKIIIEKKKK